MYTRIKGKNEIYKYIYLEFIKNFILLRYYKFYYLVIIF